MNMNKQIITSILAVLLSVATSFASTTAPTIISKGKTFVIDSKIWKTETVDISISDDNGYIIFSDVQTVSNSKTYSLENLPEGNYQVTVSNDYKSVVNDIKITKDMITIEYAAVTSYKPIMNITDENIDINFLTEGNTYMYIYNDNDTDTIFSDMISKDRSINKRFNISNLEKGSYTVVISNNNQTYSKSFSK